MLAESEVAAGDHIGVPCPILSAARHDKGKRPIEATLTEPHGGEEGRLGISIDELPSVEFCPRQCCGGGVD